MKELLAASALFSGLPEPLLAQLAAEVRLIPAATGGNRLLFEAGSPGDLLYLPLAEPSAPGPAALLGFGEGAAPLRMMPGELIGDIDFLLSGLAPRPATRQTSARLLAPLRLIAVPSPALAALTGAHEPFRRRLIRDAARRLSSLLRDRVMPGRHPEIALLRRLLEFFDDYGEVEGNLARLRRKQTQAEIAGALGVSLRLFSQYLGDWSRRGLTRSLPLTLLDYERASTLIRAGELPPSDAVQEIYHEAMTQVQAGDLLRAARLAGDGLVLFPENPALLYLLALCAARSSNLAEAMRLLRRPALDGPSSLPGLRDHLASSWSRSLNPQGEAEEANVSAAFAQIGPELGRDLAALRARLMKDHALTLSGAPRREALLLAARHYSAIHQDRPDPYPAINAAGLFTLAGEADAARLSALEAQKRAGTSKDPWAGVTRAEAALLLGETATALHLYAGAAPPAGAGIRAAARRQLAVLAEAGVKGASEARDLLDPGPVLVFSGMILRPGDGALTPGLEAAAKAFLDNNPAPLLVSGLAAGADLIFAEAALERGIPLSAVLPFHGALYEELSVGPAWAARYHACLDAAREVTELWPGPPVSGQPELYFHEADLWMLGQAILSADRLSTRARIVTMADQGQGGSAGTSAFLRATRASGCEIVALDVPPRPSLAAASRQTKPPAVFAPVLFAHATETGSEEPLGALLHEAGLEIRRLKSQQLCGDLLCHSREEALSRAAALLAAVREEGLGLTVICDYGPVLRRNGTPDREALLRLEAAGDRGPARPGVICATPGFVLPALAIGARSEGLFELSTGRDSSGARPGGLRVLRRLFQIEPQRFLPAAES